MANMGFTEAFTKYGAELANPQWAVSAIADDGALVTSCWAHCMETIGNVLRYEDTLSRWSGNKAGNNLLREHLTQAVENKLPVRCLIARTKEQETVDGGLDASQVKKEFYLRDDLIGEVISFDGDKFVIEFKKKPNPA